MNIKHLEKSECFFFSFTNNKAGGVIWSNLYRHEKTVKICYNLTMW